MARIVVAGSGAIGASVAPRAVAEELVHGEALLDVGPYRLERFEAGTVFPEPLVL